jgi:hypothetical protein
MPERGKWESDHLLFRDFLRTHPEQAAAYLTLKRNLAMRFGDDRIAYTDGKDAFVTETLQRAEEWAHRIGWGPWTAGGSAWIPTTATSLQLRVGCRLV